MKVKDLLKLDESGYTSDFIAFDNNNGRKLHKIWRYDDCEIVGIQPTLEIPTRMISPTACARICLCLKHEDVKKVENRICN